MAMFTAEGLTYPQACQLMKELRQNRIECGETTGAIAVYPTPDQLPLAGEICKRHKASFQAGYSRIQEEFLLKHGDFSHVVKVTRDAESVMQEWS